MMRATTSTAGGTTTSGKVAATGQATTPCGTFASAARAPTASATATSATTTPAPFPIAPLAWLTSSPAPAPRPSPTGIDAHSGTCGCTGKTPTATAVSATATNVVPCGPPRTAINTDTAIASAPDATDAAMALRQPVAPVAPGQLNHEREDHEPGKHPGQPSHICPVVSAKQHDVGRHGSRNRGEGPTGLADGGQVRAAKPANDKCELDDE